MGSCATMVLIPRRWTPGSVIAGAFMHRFNHVGKVLGDEPHDIRPPGPPGWRSGVRSTTLPRKKTR